jgi:hypothetical protein
MVYREYGYGIWNYHHPKSVLRDQGVSASHIGRKRNPKFKAKYNPDFKALFVGST